MTRPRSGKKTAVLAVVAALLVIGLFVSGALVATTTPQAVAAAPLQTLTYQKPTTLKGIVQRAIHVGGYTYLELECALDVTCWAVVMGRGADEGADIELNVWATHPSFRSPKLNRTFSPLAFATLE